jgi:hypothetical protein
MNENYPTFQSIIKERKYIVDILMILLTLINLFTLNFVVLPKAEFYFFNIIKSSIFKFKQRVIYFSINSINNYTSIIWYEILSFNNFYKIISETQIEKLEKIDDFNEDFISFVNEFNKSNQKLLLKSKMIF